MWKARLCHAGVVLALVAPAFAGATAQKAAPAAATPAAGAKTGGNAAVGGALPFIQDDSTTALAEAKRRGVPIFVEAWAPW